MANILVAGNVNIETTARVDGFPLPYQPTSFSFFGIGSHVSAVGYNIARALTVLGDTVALVSLIGNDTSGAIVRATLHAEGIEDRFVLGQISQTPQSVVLYDATGRRHVLTDLKDVLDQAYPPAVFLEALRESEVAVLTNIAYCRPLLALARQHRRVIATDVHTLADLDDAYNRPFLDAASILFMSGERLPEPPDRWIQRVFDRYPAQIVGIGLGAEGAMVGVRATGRVTHEPAVAPQGVVNSSGGGDALFAAFIHYYAAGLEPEAALRRAVVFAGYKVGAAASSEGFLDHESLERLVARGGS